MLELLTRLAGIDSDAEQDVRIIDHFDALVRNHAGFTAFVRAAAVLSGCPVGLIDIEGRRSMRIAPTGEPLPPATTTRADWAVTQVPGYAGVRVWLERAPGSTRFDAMILERLVTGLGIVLDRTEAKSASADPASVEILLDQHSDGEARARAARRLGLAVDTAVRVVACLPPACPDALTATQLTAVIGRVGAAVTLADAASPIAAPAGRTGTGPRVAALEAYRSWDCALTALCLTGDASDANPGPRHLDYEQLGALGAIVAHLGRDVADIVDTIDLQRLDAVEREYPGALRLLAEIAEHASARQAATALFMHHSSLHTKLERIEDALGFEVQSPAGRRRLSIALCVRRIHVNGPLP